MPTSEAYNRSARSKTPRRVLFARVGWMTFYSGPQPDDERPRGGGAYTRKRIGHELFNFAEFGERLFGFVRAKNSRIKLERIDPGAADSDRLSDVLVIFIAKQRVIGWYRSAVVLRTGEEFPRAVTAEMLRRLRKAGVKSYSMTQHRFECAVKDAVLLPTVERTEKVPGNVKGGYGQSNIRYFDDGNQRARKWMSRVLAYVQSYSGANLLANPTAQSTNEVAATIAQERVAGFQSDPDIRREIELYAMRVARKKLKARGYSDLRDTSAQQPYDFTCKKYDRGYFVEVKGTQTASRKIILTRGEVEHVRTNPDSCILALVQRVKVAVQRNRGKRTITVSGGSTSLKEGWRPRDEDLEPIQYLWTID